MHVIEDLADLVRRKYHGQPSFLSGPDSIQIGNLIPQAMAKL
jgi:hypothetical protein